MHCSSCLVINDSQGVTCRIHFYLALEQVRLSLNEGMDVAVDDEHPIFRFIFRNQHHEFWFRFFGELDFDLDNAAGKWPAPYAIMSCALVGKSHTSQSSSPSPKCSKRGW